MDAFISIDKNQTEWRFTVLDLLDSLLKQYPNAKTRVIQDPKRKACCDWSIRLPESSGKMIEGFLTRTGVDIVLKGMTEDCADFAIWVRNIVPSEICLYFWDDQHSFRHLLANNTEKEDLVANFR